jgi:hypothetical protein
MIIALILALLIIVSTHLFVMDSVDKFNGYGDGGGTYREWVEFERQANSIDI